MVRIYRAFFIATLAVPACKSSDAKEAPAPAPAAAKPAEPAAPPAPAASWLQLPQYKLQVLVPQPAKVEDTSVGDIKHLSIEAGAATFNVGPISGEEAAATLDQLAKGLSSDPNVKMTVTKKDKLADGFHVEVTTESGMVQIEVRRKIGATEYSCGIMAPDADTAKVVRDACLSLKPL